MDMLEKEMSERQRLDRELREIQVVAAVCWTVKYKLNILFVIVGLQIVVTLSVNIFCYSTESIILSLLSNSAKFIDRMIVIL